MNVLYLKSRYTALDACRLVSMEDEYFHCEVCNGELVAESEKIGSQEVGDGDDNARRRRRDKLEDMLKKMEVCVLVCYTYLWFDLTIFDVRFGIGETMLCHYVKCKNLASASL